MTEEQVEAAAEALFVEASKEQPNIWCNTHQRPAELCKTRGGIMIPCRIIDLTDQLEIEFQDNEVRTKEGPWIKMRQSK